jgi:Metallo-peptidase family M12B Reprolysin-like
MTITIFKDKDCKGKSQTVTNDMADLKDQPADKPSSIRLTGGNEAVLLFKNDDWHGGALYIRGPMTVSDLGSGKEGGRYGFGNSVRSIRRTSFSVDLNVNIVTDSGDRMPGIWKDRAQAEASVRNIVSLANGFLADKRALLKCEIARVRFRLDTKQFDLSNAESWAFPGEWKEKDEVDVIVVNRFSKEEVGGRAKLPCFGQTLVIAAMANMSSGPDEAMTDEDLANVFAHELGHYFGLTHNTADDKQNNIMFEDFSLGEPLSGRTIWVDQIRELQDRLANHHTRRGDRD